jgi:hypothetical protein
LKKEAISSWISNNKALKKNLKLSSNRITKRETKTFQVIELRKEASSLKLDLSSNKTKKTKFHTRYVYIERHGFQVK